MIEPAINFQRLRRMISNCVSSNYEVFMIRDHNGNKYKSKSQMCRSYGINIDLYNKRIQAGWSIEKALTTQIMNKRRGKYG